MCSERVIVLKFGGSVLRDEATLRRAVHEVYRWRREDHQVVAVVSALAGQTDALLGTARSICDLAAPAAVAALASTGELRSAALLGLQLDRAGVPACVLTPAAIRLVAAGDPLDADPVSLDEHIVRRALRQHGVVVMPGYAAQDALGRPVVLGRGGSDLTALFLAHRLRPSRCRLIKDVDGLYVGDPAGGCRPPARYGRASWADALATDGTIVQHKALAFARKHNVRFEIGRLNGERPTEVGAEFGAFGEAEPPACLRVALLGLGTVGGGVLQLLQQLPEHFEVVAVARRDLSRASPAARGESALLPGARDFASDRGGETEANPGRFDEFRQRRADTKDPLRGTDDFCHGLPASVPAHLVTTDAVAAATCGADVVVETIGGLEPAAAAIEQALRCGADVVTANKALLAREGPRLASLANALGRRLHYSAAVGGSMPLLERIASLRRGVRTVRAILNGTTNFILEMCARGTSFEAAVGEAQLRGFAERDPHRDLSGLDAADKLCVIAHTAGVRDLWPGHIGREALTEESVGVARRRAGDGQVVRHVATLDLDQRCPRASVRLTPLESGDPLADVPAEENSAVIDLANGEREVIRGRGAGRWPTAEAVVADLLEISRRNFARPGATAESEARSARSAAPAPVITIRNLAAGHCRGW
jgi:homoserine dehydrogenase